MSEKFIDALISCFLIAFFFYCIGKYEQGKHQPKIVDVNQSFTLDGVEYICHKTKFQEEIEVLQSKIRYINAELLKGELNGNAPSRKLRNDDLNCTAAYRSSKRVQQTQRLYSYDRKGKGLVGWKEALKFSSYACGN